MLPVNGANEQYLAGLSRIQDTLNTVERQISSGLRVGQASDDPAAVPAILQTQAQIAANTQAKTNLNTVSAELQGGDGALQQAISLLEQATSLASQGGSSSTTDSQRAQLVNQVQTIQQQLVSLSATTVGGRYIFSGDLDQQALYSLDSTQPEGVKLLANATSTRTVVDATGSPVWTPPTAQQIFDPKNSDGTPAIGNTFAAVNDLLTALQTNNVTTISATVSGLNSADDYLNQQLGLYGIAQNHVTNSLNSAASTITNDQQQLSNLRDADVANDALILNQAQLQQQASLSAGAKMSQLSLFSFLA